MIPSDHWYKNAIIYNLDVAKFQDSDGDGIGDFVGLRRRLEYLDGLGVTCLWLLPFYPSPMRDNGYDVADYYGVAPQYGTLGDFVDFMREARERGIRVLVDLVVNHTSNEHPWFQAARSDPDSPYRDWYVWADEPPEGVHEPAFPGEQESVWAYDEQAGSHYLHHFYKFQPDLNLSNPAVREEIKRIMGFWIELGVSGFRVDAAPFLIEDDSERGRREGGQEQRYAYLREFREFLDRRNGEAVLLAEANVSLDHLPRYYGPSADRFHMVFGFHQNQHLFLALARQQAEPLARSLRELPPIPPVCQWANFVRNHDELSLNRLSDTEQEEVFAAFAPDPEAQIYGRGIRRRFPPMVDGDWRQVALAYSLMFTLPGAPVLRYGEEIGMGDDLSLEGRETVRTLMQWDSGRNGGFSTAPPEKLVKPTIAQGPFGYTQGTNVEEQERNRDSLLNRIAHMAQMRKRSLEFGFGEVEIIDTNSPSALAHAATWAGKTVLAVHNLADGPVDLKLDLNSFSSQQLHDLLGDETYEPTEGTTYRVRLNPYGYRWFRVGTEQGE